MSELNQCSLEEDECNDMFITQEPKKEPVDGDSSVSAMEIDESHEETGIFDMGSSILYSDISEDEATEAADFQIQEAM